MSFYDTQTYCGIVDMKVVVVGICNKINFTKVWITLSYAKLTDPENLISDYDNWNFAVFNIFSIYQ